MRSGPPSTRTPSPVTAPNWWLAGAEQTERSRSWSRRGQRAWLPIEEFRGSFLEEVAIEQGREGWMGLCWRKGQGGRPGCGNAADRGARGEASVGREGSRLLLQAL